MNWVAKLVLPLTLSAFVPFLFRECVGGFLWLSDLFSSLWLFFGIWSLAYVAVHSWFPVFWKQQQQQQSGRLLCKNTAGFLSPSGCCWEISAFHPLIFHLIIFLFLLDTPAQAAPFHAVILVLNFQGGGARTHACTCLPGVGARRHRHQAPSADIRGHCDTGQEPVEPSGAEWGWVGLCGKRRRTSHRRGFGIIDTPNTSQRSTSSIRLLIRSHSERRLLGQEAMWMCELCRAATDGVNLISERRNGSFQYKIKTYSAALNHFSFFLLPSVVTHGNLILVSST